jgi:hypothetical protein
MVGRYQKFYYQGTKKKSMSGELKTPIRRQKNLDQIFYKEGIY